jgi:hypothetical protein
MPTLHSHTHCQAAQANAQTQAWQRVCLSQRSTKPTENRAEKEEARCPNITYTQAGVSSFVGQVNGKFKVRFFVGKFSGKNPCLRIAENRQTV